MNLLKSTTNLNRGVRLIFTTSKRLINANVNENGQEVEFEVDREKQEAQEARINQIRNKSRLLNQHRNMLHETIPYAEPQSWIHNSLKYQRKLFGKYGSESRVDPRICFPSKSEFAEKKEFEKVAYPFTLQEMLKTNEKLNTDKAKAVLKREDDITKNLGKLEQWKSELANKVAKKELDAKIAKDRKDRLVEEVRRHFGFKVDPKDDKFKELLEQKEKEDKKLSKEAKRKVKEAKMLAKLVEPSLEPLVKASVKDQQ